MIIKLIKYNHFNVNTIINKIQSILELTIVCGAFHDTVQYSSTLKSSKETISLSLLKTNIYTEYLILQRTFNKLYRCTWVTRRECAEDFTSPSGSTEYVETSGRAGELIEFVSPIPVAYSYDNDTTVRFEL